MGFAAPVTTYRLKFADPALAGLEVTVRSVPIAEFLRVSALMDGNETTTTRMTATFQALAGALVSWNLEDAAGQPVPATFDGITGLEAPFVMRIFSAWMSAMAGPSEDDDLGKGSGSGGTSAEASLPMVPLPESPGN